MRRTLYPIVAGLILCAAMLMTSCNKNGQNSPDQPANVQTYRMRITASQGADAPMNGPRKVLSLDGTTLNATWAAGEQVNVYNVTRGAELNGRLEAQSGGESTQLEGDLTGTVAAGDKLTLRFLSPNYTDQHGTLAYISANCDYAVAEDIEVASVSGGQIQATGDAVFTNRQAILRLTLKDAADGTTPIAPTSLSIHDETGDIATLTSIPASTYTENGAGVLYVAVPGFSGKNITLTAIAGTDTYIYSKPEVTIEDGSYYTLSAEMSKQIATIPVGVIGKVFSVSDTKKVYFSQGNLQYRASDKTWRFALHQWDIVGMGYGQTNTAGNIYCYIGGTVPGSDNSQISSSYSGWIDLFGWGTGGQPYKSSSNNSDYFLFQEWGKKPIINGGNTANQWRTPSHEEWGYVIAGRSGAAEKCGAAKVCDMTGLVILPDVWTLPSGCAFTSGMTSASNWYDWSQVPETNTYTESQWQAMEKAGAVFLPCAGFRCGTTIHDAGGMGHYWAANKYDSEEAYYVNFASQCLYPMTWNNKYYGFAVRLVQDVTEH